MIIKILRAFTKPRKAWRALAYFIHFFLRKPQGILFFVGMDPNGVFRLMHQGYKECYGFEANPERFEKLKKKFGKNPHIHLIHAAVAQYNGEIELNISSNNNGASSSLGKFKKNWNGTIRGRKIEMVKSVIVPCINLHDFCRENNISYITDYLSDIQGMDLEVLKTLKPMITSKSIGTITCEVAKNERKNIYSGLPDNSENGFRELLEPGYTLVAKGWSILRDGRFDKIPEDAWEMDCKWTTN